MGVQDIYASPENICSTAFLTCTHGHGNNVGMPAPVNGLFWEPQKEARIIAVHGTSSFSWQSIAEVSALSSIDRDSIHFTVFRPGMVLREMPQLKKRGRFIIIDPWAVSTAGYQTSVNINDVVTVTVDSDGLPLGLVLTCLDERGKIRRGNSRFSFEWKDSRLKEVVQEFIDQINEPATGFYDDSQGTTGPAAQGAKLEACVMAESYKGIAGMIPDTGVTVPIIPTTSRTADDVDREATLNTEQAEADQHRRDAPNSHLRQSVLRNIMVKGMIKFFNELSYMAPRGLATLGQTMTFVRTHLETADVPDNPVDSFDNVDYDRDSDDEVQSVTVPESVLEAFTDAELLEYEKMYNKLVDRLVTTFKGYTITECRVITEAYCLFKGFPLIDRKTAAAVSLLTSTREASASGSSRDPPGPLQRLLEFDGEKNVGEIMSDAASADNYNQSDLFKEKCALGLIRLKADWVKDPSFRVFHSELLKWSETCPKAQKLLHQCLSAEEYQEAVQPSKNLVFHDPTHSSKYMKRSHVLPQDCWIEEKLAPTEDEIAIATNELKFFTKEDLSRATALLSSDIIPHGDHEYQNAEFCSLCPGSHQEKNKAYT